ncbi:hypothetical protein H310_02807 [Aphanomyces invadans]|uniref:Reverse transcriptase domain-containing protein n=1 Tax=Aphanomyces invadans TaxID=157072 RepID=A0A024UJV7_9STRA|nr:hypothetical protein H310_02807 [Aphanomyces invadans]ETW06589.1 hypothetical protein H310_02807 [Aphanomyces invadans]|eukprot:XP_008864664.1 hypothetical protein H310_02807 [Aphanomyces invadans]
MRRLAKSLHTSVATNTTVDGVVVTDVRAVHDAFTQHWKHIMSAPTGGPPINRERRRAVVRTLSKRLSREDRATLDEPLTAAELHVALKTMDPAKSPGPDGWSAGFFQVAPAVFAEILLKPSLQLSAHCTHAGRSENLVACVVPLPRLAPKLVHPSQAGFIRGCRLHDYVILMQALQQICTSNDHDHNVKFLDFSKAYDMVDQGFLFDQLVEMNIGSAFLDWQPHLGIPLPDGDPLTSIFFADDSTLLSCDLPSAVEQMHIVEEFCVVSGAMLNQAKCMTLWPSQTEFLARMSQANPAARVRLDPSGNITWAPIYRLGMVYNHLTSLYTRLQRSVDNPPGVAESHTYFAYVKGVARPFQHWTKKMIVAMAYHAPTAYVRHPMAITSRDTPIAIASFVR